MKTLATPSIGIALALVLIGCHGGDGGCGCELPLRTYDWLIYLTIGEVPSEVVEYPIYVDVGVRIVHAETGGPPPAGFRITLSVEPGTFEGDGPVLDASLIDGRLDAAVQVDEPGTYTLTVSIPGEDLTANTSFTVWGPSSLGKHLEGGALLRCPLPPIEPERACSTRAPDRIVDQLRRS